jgi:hypothetical protein
MPWATASSTTWCQQRSPRIGRAWSSRGRSRCFSTSLFATSGLIPEARSSPNPPLPTFRFPRWADPPRPPVPSHASRLVSLIRPRQREAKADQFQQRPAGKATKRRPCNSRGAVAG